MPKTDSRSIAITSRQFLFNIGRNRVFFVLVVNS